MGPVTPIEKASKLISQNSSLNSLVLAASEIAISSNLFQKENQMTEKLDLKVRKATSNDTDFITSTWLRSVYDAHKHEFKKDVFFPSHNKMINDRLPFLKCLVAHNPEEEDQIYGFIVFNTPNIIHFAYTKSYFRKLGVFSRLLQEAGIQAPITVTHKAPMFKTLEGKYSFIFNPYKFIEVKNESSQG